ncbi:hypothetical protein [Neobacillus mesonae]|uniref:hypothetical protein n=1 Tax=Neobacillus mesonae TaxID=1193713 RepID=UPI00203F8F5C|nr:hypothetical protein [Neobacillus mesonae]MCM3569822.1 hypothetical protein [Neobacillus mesonae]
MPSAYRYLPDTEQDQEEMLSFLNLSSIDELFEDIPVDLHLKEDLNIPKAVPEALFLKKMNQLAVKK